MLVGHIENGQNTLTLQLLEIKNCIITSYLKFNKKIV